MISKGINSAQESHQISARSTLSAAADLMARKNLSMLSVYDDGQRIGVITDRDISARVIVAGLDPRTTCVRDVLEIQ